MKLCNNSKTPEYSRNGECEGLENVGGGGVVHGNEKCTVFIALVIVNAEYGTVKLICVGDIIHYIILFTVFSNFMEKMIT